LAISALAQSLLRSADYTWNNGSQHPTVLTYSFATNGSGFSYFSDRPTDAFNDAEKAAARGALAEWASVSGVEFVEVSDVADATTVDLRFRLTTLQGTYDTLEASGAPRGDIQIAEWLSGYDVGAAGYHILLRGIGYALGLQATGSVDTDYTVMGSTKPFGPRPPHLRAADIEAAQSLYGTQQAQDAKGVRWSWDEVNQGIRHEGTEANDTMIGRNVRNFMIGLGGDDAMTGGNGNDLFLPGPGSNTVSGGDGFDTLRVDLFRMDASLQASSSTVLIAGGLHLTTSGVLVGGGETTSFNQIENFAFVDGRLVFDDTDPVAQVTRLYQAVLGRVPDTVGREDWTTALQHGASLSKLADGFIGSDEFRARFGTPDDAGFVTMAYRQALGREPDAAGAADWRNHLAHGMSRAELLVGFSESDENRALTKPLLSQGIWDVDDQMADITRLYQAVLGRAPDRAGLLFWDQKVDEGMTLPQVANLFAQSQELGTRFPGATDQAFVQMVYQNTLGRAGEAAGEAFWLDHLAHGMTRGELVAGFADSTEFLVRSAGLTEHGIVLG
jgi:hypothetical protein